MSDGASSQDWTSYYEKLQDRPPRATTIFAARRFSRPGSAVDLGCGAGRDSLPLLRAGWRVTGVDREPSGLQAFSDAAGPDMSARLDLQCADFAEADWPESDLLISCFALPLAPKPAFPALWGRIVDRLIPGGRFAGQLFGPRDSWASGGVVAFDRPTTLELFRPFEIEYFEEEEHDGVTPRGKSKHWHIFHVVARKRAIA